MPASTAREAVEPYARYIGRPLAEVAEGLESYAVLLAKWQRVQNLVSRETLDQLWTRHVADSLQVLKLLQPGDARFLDLGSGGGLPAIPLAIACGTASAARFTLVEPNSRKASFLRTVARELNLPVRVEARRIEEIDSRETSPPDVITSRALASLGELFRLSARFFAPDTRAIFHKGREYGEELTEAGAHWAFDVVTLPSDTSADGVLLEIRNLRAKSVR